MLKDLQLTILQKNQLTAELKRLQEKLSKRHIIVYSAKDKVTIQLRKLQYAVLNGELKGKIEQLKEMLK